MLSLSLTEGKNTVRDFIVEVHHDEHAESPLIDCDLLGTFVCFHGRYHLGHKDGLDNLVTAIQESFLYVEEAGDYSNWEAHETTAPPLLQEYAEKCGFFVRPLFLYDHSGLTISMAEFACPWDSAQVGFVFVTPEKIAKEYPDETQEGALEKVQACVESEVKLYDMYLTGDVYGYVIKDARGNELDSCWGFYGEKDLTAAVEETISYLEKNPPFTPLSELEERMFKRIVELSMETRELDQHCNPIGFNSAVASEAQELGIRVDPEKVSE